MSDGVNKSQFYMWRTLFSVAHADNIVTDEEVAFMAHILDDINFSQAQTEILKDDIINSKDVEEMFAGITEQSDRTMFFDFARDLVWVDGDFGKQEQSVMVKLMQTHCQEVNIDDLVGSVSLELEDENRSNNNLINNIDDKKSTISDMISSFKRRFLNIISGD